MPWRYQPVIVSAAPPGEPYVCLVEAYFDDADRLKGWTMPFSSTPSGEDRDELCRDLARMMVNARCWPAVRYEDLQVGMTFTPLVTLEQREALAKEVERWGSLMDTASKGDGT